MIDYRWCTSLQEIKQEATRHRDENQQLLEVADTKNKRKIQFLVDIYNEVLNIIELEEQNKMKPLEVSQKLERLSRKVLNKKQWFLDGDN